MSISSCLTTHNLIQKTNLFPVFFQSLNQEKLSTYLEPISLQFKAPKEPPAGLTPTQSQIDAQIFHEIKAKKRAKRWAKQAFQWVYVKQETWEKMSDLPQIVREWGQQNLPIMRLTGMSDQLSQDGTHKFLWKLEDKKTIESVMIPASKPDQTKGFQEGMRFKGVKQEEALSITRRTICISSQVGCAMKCAFCLTGIQGIDRNLSIAEIVTQVYEVMLKYPLNNIVFMGMGEPLNNLDNVIEACKILLDQDGFNFSKRKITISTSGLVSKIDELGKRLDVSLAISLNATTDEIRSKIMPVNQAWNIAALLESLKRYPIGLHRRITFEYVLLKDINDSLEDAKRLVNLVKEIPHKINLIPFNEHPGTSFKRTSDTQIKNFHQLLLNHQICATVRVSRGQDILAACGQLRSSQGTAKGSERHRDFQPTI